jgi:hypothetical protein
MDRGGLQSFIDGEVTHPFSNTHLGEKLDESQAFRDVIGRDAAIGFVLGLLLSQPEEKEVSGL